MRRITTFKMFESMQDLKPMVEFLPKLNEKTKPLGFDFYATEGGYVSAKSRGNIMMDTAKECPLRDLVISIFFNEHAGQEFRLIFDTPEEDDIKGFDIWASFSYSDRPNHLPGRATLSIDNSDRENIQRVTDKIVEVLSDMKTISTSPSFFYAGKTPSEFDPIIPSFMPGLVAEVLGDHDAPKILAGAIQGAQPMVTPVVLAFKEGAPELWQRIKPWLGEGGGEVEDLADLGF